MWRVTPIWWFYFTYTACTTMQTTKSALQNECLAHQAPGLTLLFCLRLLKDHAFTLGRVVAAVLFLEVESGTVPAILAVHACLVFFGPLSRRPLTLGQVLAVADCLNHSHRLPRVSTPPQNLVHATAVEEEVAVWAVDVQHGPVVGVQDHRRAGPVQGEQHGGPAVQAVEERPPVEARPLRGGPALQAQQQQRQCQDGPGLPLGRATRRHANLGSIREQH